MNLKGQKVYVVHTFDRDDNAVGYELFASKSDANDAVNKVMRYNEKTGEHAYWTHTEIN